MKDTYYKTCHKTRQGFLQAFSFMLLLALTLILPKWVWAGQLVVTGQYVNLRQGPGVSYKLVGKVHQGDKLSYISNKGGWYQLALNNQKPWIAGWLVKEVQANPSSTPVSTPASTPSSTPTSIPTAAGKQVVVTGTYVNVRSGPGTNFGKVGQVKQNDQLGYVSESNQWVKVKLTDGREGWLAGWLVKIQTTKVVQQPQPPATSKPVTTAKQAIVRGTYVNVRSGPGIKNSKISVVFKGDQLAVETSSGDWVKIKLKDGREGWIAGWLVDLKEVPQPKPTPAPAPTPVPTPTPAPRPTQPPANQGQTTQQYATITGSIVNLRSGAGTSNSIVTKAKQGDRFKIVGSNQGWYQLDLTGGQKAWVAGWLVAVKSEPITPPASKPADPGSQQDSGSSTDTKPGSDQNSGPSTGANPGSEQGSDSNGASRGGQPTVNDIDQQSGQAVHKLVKTNRIGIFVRKGPAVTYNIFDTLDKDVELTVYRETDDWYLVQLPSKNQGWIVKSVADEISQEANQNSTNLVVKLASDNSQAVISGVQGKYETVADPQGLWFKVIFPEEIFKKESVVNVNQGTLDRYEIKQLPSAAQGIELTFFFTSKTYVKATAGDANDQIQINFSTGSLAGKTIVIDPGHGDFDPGASGPSGLQEKDVVLDIGKRVAENLRQLGANVLMTRDDDTFVPLGVRADLANTKNADIFVSIHANSSEKSSVTGTATYFYAPSSDPDLYAQYNQRHALASAVETNLVNAIGTRSLGLKQERFAVIRLTKMPSILVETAFISNPTEEHNLADSNFRAKAAQGITQGIQEYFQEQ